MADLIESRSITLTSAQPRLQSPLVSLSALTSSMTITLQRPTTLNALNWSSTSTVRITLVFMVDGVEFRCVGRASGGIRKNHLGEELSEYKLFYKPTVLFGDKAWAYLATQTKDADGYYYNVPLSRLGETGTTIQGYLLLERLSGHIETVLTIAATTESAAPVLDRYKNSVAFDAATDAQEIIGDGVLSLSSTAAGTTNLGAFAAVLSEAARLGSVTYNGVTMTEAWDLTLHSIGCAGHVMGSTSNITGTKTVTSTLASSCDYHFLSVITMTGVDQTTPTSGATTTSNSSTSISQTVSGVVSGDMVVDACYSGAFSSVGADQTVRTTETLDGKELRTSTQEGANGGVMSWNFTEEVLGRHGAVRFIQAAAAGASLVINAQHPMAHMLVR